MSEARINELAGNSGNVATSKSAGLIKPVPAQGSADCMGASVKYLGQLAGILVDDGMVTCSAASDCWLLLANAVCIGPMASNAKVVNQADTVEILSESVVSGSSADDDNFEVMPHMTPKFHRIYKVTSKDDGD